MKTKFRFKRRFMSIVLCLSLLLSYVPLSWITTTATSSDNITRVSDPSTMDGWREFFGPEVLSTENAGGVWTDKSVFTDSSAFDGTGISMENSDSFLVALSAIASNMTVTGSSQVPTDTMLVLDVSGSMNDGRNDVAEELVEAANESIDALLSANKYNRVGVVLYSGTSSSSTNNDAAILMLPLGRYTTGSDGKYLNYNISGYWDTTETVSLDSDLVIEGTTTKPTAQSKEVVGATYIQKGIILAKDQFTAASNATAVEDPAAGTLNRKPVLVLMSDGAPTLASTNFTSPGQYNMGNGQSSSSTAALGFVSQLSAAYAKQQIEAKYNSDCLFYTLGLGVTGNSVATSVLDPANSSNAIDVFWSRYNNADLDVGGTVTVQGGGKGQTAKTVTKIAENLEQNYVDKYFAVDSSSGDLASGLKNAFKDIVGTIQLQSKYFPTLISESEDLSGYISFVDKVGEYMQVTDIKGILINNTLYSGVDLAKNFAAGANGGELGTYDNPTELGHEMVAAVQARFGIASADEARTLIGLAYEYGQIRYTNNNDYSNYIGWYANAKGEFLGFWHEGITTMPDPSDPTLTDETRPVYIIKSYGYLGAVDEEHGVAASDMMYATIQVREKIADGEQTVAFAVPAALIPITTYNVTLNEQKQLTDLAVSGAEHPIRLVYEVALDDEINQYTLKDVVSEEYLAANTNADGSVNFYTNQYDAELKTGYGTVNTYSYFNPSRQNEKYYYIEDAPVYTDTRGTLYEGDTQPSGEKYRAYTVYKKNGNKLTAETAYRRLSDAVLATAVKTEGTNNWHIQKGTVYVNMDGYHVYKGGTDEYIEASNKTGTLHYANEPFVDIHSHSVDDNTGYNFIVGATLGNNGKLTLAPETGIKLSKIMADGATAPTGSFEFVLTNTTNAADAGTYNALLVSADGTQTSTSVTFSSGAASVTLNAGETLYIGGMTANDIIKVEETANADYVVESVNGDANADFADITVESNKLKAAAFVNADRNTGSLTVAKEVEHDFGTEYNIPAEKTFEITVTLKGIGTQNASFKASQTNSTLTAVTTDADGKFTVTLKHGEQITILDLPEGTEAAVAEQSPGTGFTAQYLDNGQSGDGVVTVAANKIVSVIVVNDYAPAKVYPVNITVSGTKTLTGRSWQDDDIFTFELQKQTGENKWTTLKTDTVNGSDTEKNFDFSNAFANEEYASAGTYYYRVIEIEPTAGDLGGVTYDKTVHAFAVDVADADMDGKLEISNVRAYRTETTHISKPAADSWHVDVDFTNTYAATGKATVTIDLNKKIENSSGSPLATLGGFQFGLYEDGELKYTSALTTDRGFARFVLEYTEAGTYEYTLKEIIPSTVPDGWKYSTEEIAVTVVVTDNGAGSLKAIIYQGAAEPSNAGTAISTEFTNTYDPTDAELAVDFVNKELSGRALKAGEFNFEVQKQDGTPVLTGTNDAKGNVNFDKTLKFDKVGTYFYNIVETSADGRGVTADKTVYRVTVTVTDDNGQLKAAYSILNVAGDEINFHNTYKASNVSYAISGNKTLKGRALLNDEFTFLLTEASDADGTVAAGAKAYEAKNFTDGSFAFPEITYTNAGTYYYVVSEKAASSSYGIKYDDTEYVVSVEITDNGEGSLVVSDVSYNILGNGIANALAFTNEYIPSPTFAEIPGNKTLEGKVLSDGQFSFKLYNSNAAWDKGTELETVQNAQDGTFKFTAINFDKAGTYYYLVKEVYGGQVIAGVAYDETIFRVKIEVTDDLVGQLHSDIFVYDDYDIPQEDIRFVNIYTITGNANVKLSGTKTLNGRVMDDGEFTFELYETDEDYEISGQPSATVQNSSDEFEFGLEYKPEDVGKTFYYVVKEANDGETINGVTYSAVKYCISVKVEDNGEGGIKTVINMSDGQNSSVSSLDFVNEYRAAGKATLNGEKVLEGREIKDGEFTFELYHADLTAENVLAKKGEPVAQTTNNAEGKFAFEELSYTQGGTYYYVIAEKNNGLGGVTYDETEYSVFVVVKDNKDGTLSTDIKVYTEGQPADKIEFHNSYKAEVAKLVIDGQKTLEGREIKDGEFTFELYHADLTAENVLAKKGEPVAETTNNAEGKFAFEELSYTQDGTYYYIIVEKNNGVGGVTYDETEYSVFVKVTDKLDGTYEVDVKNYIEAALKDEVIFNNTYKADSAELTIKGQKTLQGRELKADEFTFKLYATDASFAVSGNAIGTVKNDANGQFAFESIVFDEIGTYFYIVAEDASGEAEGITYDSAVYKIKVLVTDDSNGKLVVNTEMIKDENTKAEQILFTNVFTPATPPATPEDPILPEYPELPKTGDNTNLTLWFALLLVSGGGLITTSICGRKKKAKQN